jgi:hypothetical protein
MAAVPHSADAQRKLQAAGVRRPVHDNGHSRWNRYVRAELEGIRTKINGEKFESKQEEDEAIRNELDQLTVKLRDRMMHDDRISSIEGLGDVPTV